MSDLLSIGASGIKAYSRALATVSDNIANSQTPGYARRTIRLEEARASGDMVLYRNNLRPGGVAVGGVVRAVDDWLVADSRVSLGDASRNTARLEWMDITERALDDGSDGVGSSEQPTTGFGASQARGIGEEFDGRARVEGRDALVELTGTDNDGRAGINGHTRTLRGRSPLGRNWNRYEMKSDPSTSAAVGSRSSRSTARAGQVGAPGAALSLHTERNGHRPHTEGSLTPGKSES